MKQICSSREGNNMLRKGEAPTLKQAAGDCKRLIEIEILNLEIEQEQIRDAIIRRGGRT